MKDVHSSMVDSSLPRLSVSPISKKRKDRTGKFSRSPHRSRTILPSLTYPTQSPNSRISITSLMMADTLDDDGDFVPHPPSTNRQARRPRLSRSASMGRAWKKGVPTSPNYRVREGKQLELVRGAVERHLRADPSLVEEEERRCRISILMHEQENRTRVFRKYCGVEDLSPAGWKKRTLQDNERDSRQLIVQQRQMEWQKVLVQAVRVLQEMESSLRTQTTQVEAATRYMLLGLWLGETGNNNPPHVQKLVQETRRAHPITEEQQRQFESKKQVLLESEELRRDRVNAEEKEGRKLVLAAWLTDAPSRHSSAQPPLPKEPRTCNPRNTPTPPLATPMPDVPMRPAPSADVLRPKPRRAEPAVAVGTEDVTVSFDCGPAAPDMRPDPALASAFSTALSAMMLAEESTRMEISALEKKDFGELHIKLLKCTRGGRPGSRSSRTPSPCTEQLERHVVNSAGHIVTPITPPRRSSTSNTASLDLGSSQTATTPGGAASVLAGKVLPTSRSKSPSLKGSQSTSSTSNTTTTAKPAGERALPPAAPIQDVLPDQDTGANKENEPPQRVTSNPLIGNHQKSIHKRRAMGEPNTPLPFPDLPTATNQRQADHLARTLIKFTAREMALVGLQESVRRGCLQRQQQQDMESIAFRFWRFFVQGIPPLDAEDACMLAAQVAEEEETLQRHSLEMQQENAHKQLFLQYHSALVRDSGLSRRL